MISSPLKQRQPKLEAAKRILLKDSDPGQGRRKVSKSKEPLFINEAGIKYGQDLVDVKNFEFFTHSARLLRKLQPMFSVIIFKCDVLAITLLRIEILLPSFHYPKILTKTQILFIFKYFC